MSEIVKDPPWVRPREPDISIKDSSKEPLKWLVVVGHHGHFCDNLLVRCLREVFNYKRREAKAVARIIVIPHVAVGILQDVTRDYAETKANIANDYCREEQELCPCISSLRFEAIQLNTKG